jgi:hypothetical protein
MSILTRILILVAVLVGIDFVTLNGRYSTRVWHQAHRHGQAMSAEMTRWLNKVKF